MNEKIKLLMKNVDFKRTVVDVIKAPVYLEMSEWGFEVRYVSTGATYNHGITLKVMTKILQGYNEFTDKLEKTLPRKKDVYADITLFMKGSKAPAIIIYGER